MATIRELLAWGSRELAALQRPTHEASLLLAGACGWSKEKLFAAITDSPSEEAEKRFRGWVALRAAGRPAAYLLGEKEFYGRTFRCDPRALIPRPDTETVVEHALELARRRDPAGKGLRIHDCCTGTGCIAITLALELKEAEVTASDISLEALELAKENCERLAPGRVAFFASDLLETVPRTPVDILTANPPYLTREETESVLAEGWGEPSIALDGGESGVDLIDRLIEEAMESLNKNGYILIEAADHQAEDIRHLLRLRGYREIETFTDLAGLERLTVGRYGSDH
ncbi:MAG: peptide chain release factor N(5)-glutamine methyltransferase [Alkalispirochaetaceae bacterium]